MTPESIPSGALKVAETAPERIYLVIGEDCPPDVRWDQLAEVTWCEDNIDGNGIEYVRLDPASPAPQATPTMADALAAGDGTLHGAIDYWQKRALAAEAQATGTLREEWHAPGLGEVHSSNHDVMIYCEKRDIHDMEQGYIVDDDTARRVAAALSSAKREAEPDSGPWTITETGNLQSADFTHDVKLGISGDFANRDERLDYARSLADKLNAAPLARSPLTAAQSIKALADCFNEPTEEQSLEEVRHYEEFCVAIVRAIEAAHGIVAPTLQAAPEDKHD